MFWWLSYLYIFDLIIRLIFLGLISLRLYQFTVGIVAFDFAFSIVMLFLFDLIFIIINCKLQLLFDTSSNWFSPNFIGCKLSQHQGSAGPDLPDCCWHDQGQNPRGDPQDLQHQEWLHPWGGRGDPQGEPVGLWVRRCWALWSLMPRFRHIYYLAMLCF